MGVAPGEATPIVNSILDWIDPDDQTHPEGAETQYYQGLNPPYAAKNGPIDDISELLLIKGVTPEIYYGGVLTNYQPNFFSRQRNPFGQSANAAPTIIGRPDQPLHAAFRRQGQHQHRLGGSPPNASGR